MQSWKLEPAHDLGLPMRERLRSLGRESGLIGTGAHLAWWSLIRGYLALIHRFRVVGREHLPSAPPFVMIANHSSHLDALALAAPLPWHLRDRVFPIAAGDTFFENLSTAMFATLAINALPIWRKNCDPRDLATMRRRLVEEPCAFVLFPEGTRARDGTMARFRRGVGMLVAGTAVPVVPCHLDETFRALPPQRSLPRPLRITLRVGRPMSFEGVANDADGWTRVTADLEAAVRALGAR